MRTSEVNFALKNNQQVLICKKMYNPVFSIRMKNRRKIAAKRVFSVFGNSDV